MAGSVAFPIRHSEHVTDGQSAKQFMAVASYFVATSGDLRPILWSETMPQAIIRGANGRRHEVDFGDAPVRIQIYASDETIGIFIEADYEALPEERRRFALLNIPRQCLAKPAPQPRYVPGTSSYIPGARKDVGAS